MEVVYKSSHYFFLFSPLFIFLNGLANLIIGDYYDYICSKCYYSEYEL